MNKKIDEKIENEIKDVTFKISDNIKYKNTEDKTILILSGGAIKGIAHLGALKILNDNNRLKKIDTIAGTSIGGVIGFLYLIGYTPEELFYFVKHFDFSKMKNTNIGAFIKTYGLDNGKKIMNVIEKLMNDRGYDSNITMEELYKKTKKELYLTTVCINDKQTYYLSYKTYPKMRVIKALRMTIALSPWFTPVKYENRIYIDGGFKDNYPINLFKERIGEVIGIYLSDTVKYMEKIENLEDFFINIFECMTDAITNYHIIDRTEYTILVKLENIKIYEMNLNEEKKKEIFDRGCDAVKNYLLKIKD